MNSDISWSAASGNEVVTSIIVGDEVFVRPDWNAYERGYETCKDDVRRSLENLWWWTRMDEDRVEQIWDAIASLPRDDEDEPDENSGQATIFDPSFISVKASLYTQKPETD